MIRSNFGVGMFSELFKPYLQRTYPVTMEEVRHSKQKELRIIDTLEPVMNQHKLIIDPEVIRNDYESVQHHPPEKAQRYMLTYQMTRITKDRGSLAHDDRLDVVAMAVQDWVEQMAADADQLMEDHKQAILEAELEKFLGGVNTLSPKSNKDIWF